MKKHRNNGKMLEVLVKQIHDGLAGPNTEVTHSEKFYDEENELSGEVDVTIKDLNSGSISGVECRDRPSDGAQERAWIRTIFGAMEDLGLGEMTAVSTTGFTAGAKKAAHKLKINLVTWEELKENDPYFVLREISYDFGLHWEINGTIDIETVPRIKIENGFTIDSPLFKSQKTGELVSLRFMLSNLIEDAKKTVPDSLSGDLLFVLDNESGLTDMMINGHTLNVVKISVPIHFNHICGKEKVVMRELFIFTVKPQIDHQPGTGWLQPFFQSLEIFPGFAKQVAVGRNHFHIGYHNVRADSGSIGKFQSGNTPERLFDPLHFTVEVHPHADLVHQFSQPARNAVHSAVDIPEIVPELDGRHAVHEAGRVISRRADVFDKKVEHIAQMRIADALRYAAMHGVNHIELHKLPEAVKTLEVADGVEPGFEVPGLNQIVLLRRVSQKSLHLFGRTRRDAFGLRRHFVRFGK